jgi:hypothetical protein
MTIESGETSWLTGVIGWVRRRAAETGCPLGMGCSHITTLLAGLTNDTLARGGYSLRSRNPIALLNGGGRAASRIRSSNSSSAQGNNTLRPGIKSSRAPRSPRGSGPWSNPPMSRTSIVFRRFSRAKVPEADRGTGEPRAPHHQSARPLARQLPSLVAVRFVPLVERQSSTVIGRHCWVREQPDRAFLRLHRFIEFAGLGICG